MKASSFCQGLNARSEFMVLHVCGRESHGLDHVSLNSPRRLVEASKQEVGRAYLIFEYYSQAEVLRKQTRFKVESLHLSFATHLFFFVKCMPVVDYYYKSLSVNVEKTKKKKNNRSNLTKGRVHAVGSGVNAPLRL